MKPSKMALALIGTAFAGGGKTITLPMEQMTVSRENWVSQNTYPFCSNDRRQCMARVGGYTRSPNNTAWNWETLLRVKQGTKLPVKMDSVVLRAHIKDLKLGAYPRQMTLFRQNLRSTWDSISVYEDFNRDQWTADAWDTPLGTVDFSPSAQGWVEFKSPMLNKELATWSKDPSMMRAGMILSGNFYYSGYYADFDSLELRVFNPDTDGDGTPDAVDSLAKDFRSVVTDSVIPQSAWTLEPDGSVSYHYDFSRIAQLSGVQSPQVHIPAGVIADSLAPVLVRTDANPNLTLNIDQANYRLKVKLNPGKTYAQPLPIPRRLGPVDSSKWVLSTYSESAREWVQIPIDSISQNAVWFSPPAVGGFTEIIVAPVQYAMNTLATSNSYSFADDQGGVHRIKIGSQTLVGASEIPKGLFLREMALVNPSKYAVLPATDPEYLIPVHGVSFAEAVLFCNQLSKSEYARKGLMPDTAYKYSGVHWNGKYPVLDGLKPDSMSGGYRLPYEWEWNVAATTLVANKPYGPGVVYPWGSTLTDQWAWSPINSPDAYQKIGQKLQSGQYYSVAYSQTFRSSEFYDLIGNVAEWTQSAWDDFYWSQMSLVNIAPPPAVGGNSPGPKMGSAFTGANNSGASNALMGEYGRVVVKGGSNKVYPASSSDQNLDLHTSHRRVQAVVYPDQAVNQYESDISDIGFRVARGRSFATLGDLDQDGLPDNEEFLCIQNPDQDCFHTAADGSKASIKGASPFHKDIFTQVLYSDDIQPISAALPRYEALDSIRTAFGRAPFANIDGSIGIAVHIPTAGNWKKLSIPETYTAMDQAFVRLWGQWIQDGKVYHQTANINRWTREVGLINQAEDEAYFQLLYVNNISRWDISSPTTLVADTTKPLSGWAGGAGWGTGRVGNNGNCSMGLDWVKGGSEQSIIWGQAQTMMHELGHNLGLGGDVYNGPSDVSVMNYSQGTGGAPGFEFIREDGKTVADPNYPGSDYYIDYGRGGIPDIDGTKLVDGTPLNTSNLLHAKVFLKGESCGKDGELHDQKFGWSNSPQWSIPPGCAITNTDGKSYDWCPAVANLAEYNAMADSLKKCDVLTGLKVINFGPNDGSKDENIKSSQFVGEWSSVKIWPRSTSQSSLPLPTSAIQY